MGFELGLYKEQLCVIQSVKITLHGKGEYMKVKKIGLLTVALCCVVMAFAVSCSKKDGQVARKTYHWKYGTVDATSNVNFLAAQELVKYLEEAVPGKWTIELYPSSQLGNAEEMVESLQLGALEMCGPVSAAVANYVPEFGVWDMPFLFRDEAHVDAVLSGPIGLSFNNLTEKANIKFVAWWEVGFRCLANNRREIYTPDDIKGLRLRVMSNEIHQALFATLGADPVPMSLADAYVANQNGTIDGQDNPLANMIANRTYEVCKYFTVTNHVYSPLPVVMSMKAWNEMTPEDQKTFMACVDKATIWQRNANREAQRKAADELQSMGNIVTYPDISLFEDRMQTVYSKYPQYADLIRQIKAVN
jgi:tripartite ATP-independent transporter DctP family solute receptor